MGRRGSREIVASYLKIAKGFAEQKVVCYYCQFLWQSSNFQPPNMLKLDKLYFSTKMCRWISCGVLLTLRFFTPSPPQFSSLSFHIRSSFLGGNRLWKSESTNRKWRGGRGHVAPARARVKALSKKIFSGVAAAAFSLPLSL